jgi:hypothetical protein
MTESQSEPCVLSLPTRRARRVVKPEQGPAEGTRTMPGPGKNGTAFHRCGELSPLVIAGRLATRQQRLPPGQSWAARNLRSSPEGQPDTGQASEPGLLNNEIQHSSPEGSTSGKSEDKLNTFSKDIPRRK